MQQFNQVFRKNYQDIDPSAHITLLKHPWRGNVRELRNLVERIVLAGDGSTITSEDLYFLEPASSSQAASLQIEHGLESELEKTERRLIQQAFIAAHGDRMRAAEILHLTLPALVYRLKRLGIVLKRDFGILSDPG
jgi:transcriptional regulator with PAS, ATPase and Fis domain